MAEESLSTISSLVGSLRTERDIKKVEEVWRRRGAEKILDEGYCTGCTDRALVFIYLAKALDIPTIYVETIKKESLHDLNFSGVKNLANLEGHAFCDVVIGDKLIPFDPSYGKTEIINGSYIRDPKGRRVEYEVLGKGTDYNQIFLKQGNIFEKNPVSLQTKEEISQAVCKVFAKK